MHALTVGYDAPARSRPRFFAPPLHSPLDGLLINVAARSLVRAYDYPLLADLSLTAIPELQTEAVPPPGRSCTTAREAVSCTWQHRYWKLSHLGETHAVSA